MGVQSVANGTQTAAVGSEHDLSTQTGVGVYVLVVDTTNMASGDTLELRVKTKNQAGEAAVESYVDSYSDAQTSPQKYTVPVPVDTEITVTLKQTAGTARDFPWNLLRM